MAAAATSTRLDADAGRSSCGFYSHSAGKGSARQGPGSGPAYGSAYGADVSAAQGTGTGTGRGRPDHLVPSYELRRRRREALRQRWSHDGGAGAHNAQGAALS